MPCGTTPQMSCSFAFSQQCACTRGCSPIHPDLTASPHPTPLMYPCHHRGNKVVLQRKPVMPHMGRTRVERVEQLQKVRHGVRKARARMKRRFSLELWTQTKRLREHLSVRIYWRFAFTAHHVLAYGSMCWIHCSVSYGNDASSAPFRRLQHHFIV
jgi:hypothetical protein